MHRPQQQCRAAIRLSLIVLCAAALAARGYCAENVSSAPAAPPVAPLAATQAMTTIVNAIATNDYKQFMNSAPFEDAFKTAMTQAVFANVSTQFAPRLKGGYSLHYLDALSEKGYATHLWKLSFNDKSDDVLVELSMKDGKVGGLFIL